ncbi:hypothetical protein GCM10017322_10620 [Paracoccus aerius]|nr:hypothetical protein GCM10017322_10620 [Paracoccus aerius]
MPEWVDKVSVLMPGKLGSRGGFVSAPRVTIAQGFHLGPNIPQGEIRLWADWGTRSPPAPHQTVAR